MSSEQLFVDLQNYADHQKRLFSLLSTARISSAETSMFLDNTYYSDLSYNRVPAWLADGSGVDENDVESADGLVSFPAIVTMKATGKEADETTTEWDLSIREPSTVPLSLPPPAAAAVTSSSAPSTAFGSVMGRKREDAMKKVDPRYWFSSVPPRIVTSTQDAWRNVLKEAMAMMHCQARVRSTVAAFEKEMGVEEGKQEEKREKVETATVKASSSSLSGKATSLNEDVSDSKALPAVEAQQNKSSSQQQSKRKKGGGKK